MCGTARVVMSVIAASTPEYVGVVFSESYEVQSPPLHPHRGHTEIRGHGRPRTRPWARRRGLAYAPSTGAMRDEASLAAPCLVREPVLLLRQHVHADATASGHGARHQPESTRSPGRNAAARGRPGPGTTSAAQASSGQIGHLGLRVVMRGSRCDFSAGLLLRASGGQAVEHQPRTVPPLVLDEHQRQPRQEGGHPQPVRSMKRHPRGASSSCNVRRSPGTRGGACCAGTSCGSRHRFRTALGTGLGDE